MFASGEGGDFSTFVGAATATIYRLDLGKLHYRNIPESELVAEAERKEGKLIRVPEEIRCKVCGMVFSARWIPIDGEEISKPMNSETKANHWVQATPLSRLASQAGGRSACFVRHQHDGTGV